MKRKIVPMKKIALLTAVTAILFSAALALAHVRTVQDPEEGNFVDIESAVLDHPKEPGFRSHLVSFTIDTYSSFTNAMLRPPEGDNPAIAVGVSTDGDRPFERVIVVMTKPDSEASSGYVPYALVTGGKRQRDADLNTFTPRRNLIGYGSVNRPTEDSITITVNERMLKKGGLDHFKWWARFVSSGPGEVHFDYVPNGRQARGHTS